MERIDKVIVRGLVYACAILMLAMAAIVTAQVITRYIIGRPFTWSEELSRYLFVWMSFLGMAVGVKKGSHVALDILVKKLTGVSHKVLVLVNNTLILLFGAILTYSGLQLVEIGMGQKSPTLLLPMQYVYMVIPISGILIVYFVIGEMIQTIKGQTPKEKEELA